MPDPSVARPTGWYCCFPISMTAQTAGQQPLSQEPPPRPIRCEYLGCWMMTTAMMCQATGQGQGCSTTLPKVEPERTAEKASGAPSKGATRSITGLIPVWVTISISRTSSSLVPMVEPIT